MPRHPNPRDLTIDSEILEKPHAISERPVSSPIALEGIDLSSIEGGIGLTSLPPLPSSPPTSPGLKKRPSQGILERFRPGSSSGLSKGAMDGQADAREQGQEKKEKENDDPRAGGGSMSKIYHLKKAPGSTPELRLVGGGENGSKSSTEAEASTERRPQPTPHHSEESTTSSRRKEKQFRNPLARTKSLRRDSSSKSSKPTGLAPPTTTHDQPPKTAPLTSDWPNSDMNLLKGKGKDKDKRGKSAERPVHNDSEENLAYQAHIAGPPKEKNAFMSGSKSMFGRVNRGLNFGVKSLGKIGRSSSNGEKEVPDSEYQIKVITLPLLEQTRKTRISKRIESSKDKTEYWMPSLPWRCIDYLNTNCESEGLYRVPGSGPQVKHWQRRFDQELDVDLLDEQELYDPNTIGSMLKTWLRELPTEIFPQELQNTLGAEIANDNPDYMLVGQPAPQKLRDALSDLPPYNYYLLFAITCHLSLLLSHQERNRMDLNNLSICIGPCLKMERWLFNYLVGDWRHCWQGCWTEKATLAEESRLEDPLNMPSLNGNNASTNNLLGNGAHADSDERAISSSDSATAPPTHALRGQMGPPARPSSRPNNTPLPAVTENAKPVTYIPAGMGSTSNLSTRTAPGGPVARLPSTADVRRPSTAESVAIRDAVSQAAAPSMTPRRGAGHGRSVSDLPGSPVVGK
nr:hypothetical protein B0A51_05576 [Rachicladosporium sp. CCFEE 5018]